MIVGKTNKYIEGIKCYAYDEGFGIIPIDYGTRIVNSKNQFLLDIWAKHTKARSLKHFTIKDWVNNRWTTLFSPTDVQKLIRQFKQHQKEVIRSKRRF